LTREAFKDHVFFMVNVPLALREQPGVHYILGSKPGSSFFPLHQASFFYTRRPLLQGWHVTVWKGSVFLTTFCSITVLSEKEGEESHYVAMILGIGCCVLAYSLGQNIYPYRPPFQKFLKFIY
jgi:hypothetical protein